MSDREYRSEDGRFNVRLPRAVLSSMLDECRKAERVETGGILIGRYEGSHRWACVTMATGPAEDSRRGPVTFYRGIRGLQELLSRVWSRRGGYYLGEWHYHPRHRPTPSETDTKELRGISQNRGYHCPEPVLIVVGGGPSHWVLRVQVYPRGTEVVELYEVPATEGEAPARSG